MDDTMPLPKAQRDTERLVFEEPAFGFGEETRALPGTRNFLPGTIDVSSEKPDAPAGGPLARIENMLERAITSLGDLQRRIESIEETLAELTRH